MAEWEMIWKIRAGSGLPPKRDKEVNERVKVDEDMEVAWGGVDEFDTQSLEDFGVVVVWEWYNTCTQDGVDEVDTQSLEDFGVAVVWEWYNTGTDAKNYT